MFGTSSLVEEDLQECNLYVSSVFLSCSSEEKNKNILKHSWDIQIIQRVFKVPDPSAYIPCSLGWRRKPY